MYVFPENTLERPELTVWPYLSCVQGIRYGSRRVHLQRRAVLGVEDDGGKQSQGSSPYFLELRHKKLIVSFGWVGCTIAADRG